MAVEDESLRRAVAGLLCSMLSVRYERDRVKFYGGSSKTPRSELVNESMGVRDSRRCRIGYPQSGTGHPAHIELSLSRNLAPFDLTSPPLPLFLNNVKYITATAGIASVFNCSIDRKSFPSMKEKYTSYGQWPCWPVRRQATGNNRFKPRRPEVREPMRIGSPQTKPVSARVIPQRAMFSSLSTEAG